MAKMHKFEGKEVISARVAITGAGDGLSQALAIEPEELTLGQTVHVVTECVVDKITYERVSKDSDVLVRVQRLKAGTATIVEAEMVADVLEAQRVKIEEAKGIARLDFTDGEGDDGDSE